MSQGIGQTITYGFEETSHPWQQLHSYHLGMAAVHHHHFLSKLAGSKQNEGSFWGSKWSWDIYYIFILGNFDVGFPKSIFC